MDQTQRCFLWYEAGGPRPSAAVPLHLGVSGPPGTPASTWTVVGGASWAAVVFVVVVVAAAVVVSVGREGLPPVEGQG